MSRLVAALALVLALTGCQALGPELAGQVARVVNHYCAEPPYARQALREAVAVMTAPNVIRVECAADAPRPDDPAPPPGP